MYRMDSTSSMAFVNLFELPRVYLDPEPMEESCDHSRMVAEISNPRKRRRWKLQDNILDFLPSDEIKPNGPASDAFLDIGVRSFREAAMRLHALPYGRISDRANYLLVLRENRGTCTPKHALLAALAEELTVPVILNMAICRLDAVLDARVIPFLKKANLDWLPEAHTYCSYLGKRFDLTFPDQLPLVQIEIIKEYELDPFNIGERKLKIHREFLEEWLQSQGREHELQAIWTIREEWIRSLAEV
jgi:hypothetical protein